MARTLDGLTISEATKRICTDFGIPIVEDSNMRDGEMELRIGKPVKMVRFMDGVDACATQVDVDCDFLSGEHTVTVKLENVLVCTEATTRGSVMSIRPNYRRKT